MTNAGPVSPVHPSRSGIAAPSSLLVPGPAVVTGVLDHVVDARTSGALLSQILAGDQGHARDVMKGRDELKHQVDRTVSAERHQLQVVRGLREVQAPQSAALTAQGGWIRAWDSAMGHLKRARALLMRGDYPEAQRAYQLAQRYLREANAQWSRGREQRFGVVYVI